MTVSDRLILFTAKVIGNTVVEFDVKVRGTYSNHNAVNG
jgi:hypothetical protein